MTIFIRIAGRAGRYQPSLTRPYIALNLLIGLCTQKSLFPLILKNTINLVHIAEHLLAAWACQIPQKLLFVVRL